VIRRDAGTHAWHSHAYCHVTTLQTLRSNGTGLDLPDWELGEARQDIEAAMIAPSNRVASTEPVSPAPTRKPA
jgi:hypothetical protein